MRMQGKRAVVTAGASGMGRAGARLFAQNGASVAVVDVNAEATAEVVAGIEAEGGKATGIVADLSRPEECRRIIAEAAEALGGIDALWSHAGTPGPTEVEGIDLEQYDFSVALNLTSALVCAGEVAPHMRAAGGGAILFTSSVGGLVGSMMSPVYSAVKFGIVGFTQSLAQRFAADRIRVNAVCPGPVETPMLPFFMNRNVDEAGKEANLARIMAAVPLGRLAQPEEIAHAALWLLSDDASYVTGVALPVDGGYVAR
ncbi:SDR family NAD(P)-dependent oxidoreductase [Paracoccus sp. pheM1]|uniref:SDR family NAD(P)-dependent oxidoreductase n=1 Tax=Paracoccus sp. pheM1 TaxID=2831675 RepID=UPI001BDB7174|nr:SDR family NAD(P)-dependent oxidoreductase [Paracoccus sp. pheM1]MBT0781868.1 SDR family oxidoreductase [Paracoccus sp. pheM1]